MLGIRFSEGRFNTSGRYDFVVFLREGQHKQVERVLVVLNEQDSWGLRIHVDTRFQYLDRARSRAQKSELKTKLMK